MSSGYISIEYTIILILGIFITLYAFKLAKRLGGSGLLTKTTMYTGLSSFAFGFEHFIITLEKMPYRIVIAEGAEGIAALLLLIAVYQLYKLVEGD